MKSLILSAFAIFSALNASWAQAPVQCDSVLRYAGSNLFFSLNENEREAFDYFAQCTDKTKSGNLNIAYEALKIGGGSSSNQKSCQEQQASYASYDFSTITVKTSVQGAIDAWISCVKLTSARIIPDVTTSGNLFTVGIKNETAAEIKVSIDFAKDDRYGDYQVDCKILVGVDTLAEQLPAIVDVKPNFRASVRCNRPLHGYVSASNTNETVRPGGVVSIDTADDSYSIPILSENDSGLQDKATLETLILQRVDTALKSGAVFVDNNQCTRVEGPHNYFNEPGWINALDYPVDAQCPPGYSMTGFRSMHANGFEDRVFKFHCCKIGMQFPTLD